MLLLNRLAQIDPSTKLASDWLVVFRAWHGLQRQLFGNDGSPREGRRGKNGTATTIQNYCEILLSRSIVPKQLTCTNMEHQKHIGTQQISKRNEDVMYMCLSNLRFSAEVCFISRLYLDRSSGVDRKGSLHSQQNDI